MAVLHARFSSRAFARAARLVILCAATLLPSFVRAQTDCTPAPPPIVGAKAGVKTNTAAMMALPKGAAIAKASVALVCVPDLTGMTLTEAKRKIESTNGLHFASASSNDPNSRVLSQYPPQLRKVTFGAGVTLQMTEPPVEPKPDKVLVPRITDKAENILPGYLREMRLTYGGSEVSETQAYPAGAVFQDPPAGSWVPPYSRVFRYVATAPPTPTPPQKQPVPGKTEYLLSVYPSASELNVNDQLTVRAEMEPQLENVSFEFRFADRSGNTAFVTDQNPAQYQYESDGNYRVEVIAKDAGRQVASRSIEVQVHEISWTVSLIPDKREANINEDVSFRVQLTPPSPVPRDPVYLLSFDKKRKPLVSKDGSFTYGFPVAGTHWVYAIVADADSHRFTSAPVGISVVAPQPPNSIPQPRNPWKLGFGLLGGAGILSFASLKLMSRFAVNQLSYKVDPNLGSTRITVKPAQPIPEDDIAFRIVSSQTGSRTKCDGSIVTKVVVQK